MTVNAWLDPDGEHVWIAHDCVNGRDVSMMANYLWHAAEGDGVEPSFSCSLCGVHTIVREFGEPEKPRDASRSGR